MGGRVQKFLPAAPNHEWTAEASEQDAEILAVALAHFVALASTASAMAADTVSASAPGGVSVNSWMGEPFTTQAACWRACPTKTCQFNMWLGDVPLRGAIFTPWRTVM